MAYVPLINLVPQFFDNLGDPLVGGTLNAYVAGTSTPTNMFADNAGTVAGTSVTLDSRGEPTTIKLIWLDDTVTYKFILKDSTGSTIWTEDNIVPSSVTNGSITADKLANNAVTSSKIATGAVTNSKLADASVTAGKLANSGNELGVRNRLINGRFAIDQRYFGTAQTFTAAAALAYSVDRWYGYCTGANVTGQQVAGTSPNDYNYRFTGASSVTKIGFAQRIEALHSQDMAGQTATLSVDLANSLLTSVTWTAWYANTADTFGTLASPTRTQIATGTFTVTSTLTRYTTNISIPSAATTGIEIEFSVGAQVSGTWTIGRAQLELGANATPFEYRFQQAEELLCYRYYEYDGRSIAPTSLSNFIAMPDTVTALGTNLFRAWAFKAAKRATPTMTITVTSGSGAIISARSVFGFVQTGTNSTASDSRWTASAEL